MRAQLRMFDSTDSWQRQSPAEQIQSRIEALQKSPRQVSLAAGLSPDVVEQVIAGRRARASTLARIGRILGIDLGTG